MIKFIPKSFFSSKFRAKINFSSLEIQKFRLRLPERYLNNSTALSTNVDEEINQFSNEFSSKIVFPTKNDGKLIISNQNFKSSFCTRFSQDVSVCTHWQRWNIRAKSSLTSSVTIGKTTAITAEWAKFSGRLPKLTLFLFPRSRARGATPSVSCNYSFWHASEVTYTAETPPRKFNKTHDYLRSQIDT